ncbi:cell division protein ZapA [Defluviimonas sp. WL0050]|uniref:Cell division protein ZapA n=1 Tax=Albidovulum litorale TaxID=2984134 RepID=A0ABT2ZJ27_9RHOB|nr:cell division protein ZapA [Defluviimonas sp. WL0050]MCV2871045.1 cell division protein ZapA [Defluviimonas sp. WL0050]
MPEMTITIGGRDFEVACQEGEEHFLRSAAKLLDNEATVLIGQIGRMPEARMLLMAGLMLADKAAGLEDQLRAAEERAVVAERVAANARANPERVEVPVIPEIVIDSFAEIAARAEALADRIEERKAG